MSQKTLHKNDLAHFTGSEHWYRHPLVRKVVYTDGAKYVADSAGAYFFNAVPVKRFYPDLCCLRQLQ